MSDTTNSATRPQPWKHRFLRTSCALVATAFALGATARAQVTFMSAVMEGSQEVPPNFSPGTGSGCFEVDTVALTLTYYVEFGGLTASETMAHIHGFAPPGQNAGILFPLALGSPVSGTIAITAGQAQSIIDGLAYVNIHTTNFPNGEIRGQIGQAPPQVRYCFGDGSSGACPCNNNTTSGKGEGCANTTGDGGKLTSAGFGSIHCDSLKLTTIQTPPTATAIYIQGNTSVAATHFGDGLRCTGGTLIRLAVVTSIAGGSQIPGNGTPVVSVLGNITQAGTYFYQTYYRDPDFTFCAAPVGNTWNVTNGVQVTWVP